VTIDEKINKNKHLWELIDSDYHGVVNAVFAYVGFVCNDFFVR
jgi:hypothetical protein